MLRWCIISFLSLQRVVNHYFINYQLKHNSSHNVRILYMNKQVRFIYLLLITFVFSTRTASAQTTFGSEEELKTQAAKLFDNDEFEEAYPLYSQLTSIYPKDANFNYRLGVCMLYASDDKEKPIAFLEFAANKPDVDKEALFYLAKAYHLNYRFDDAIKGYTQYKNVASAAKAEKLMVDRQIEMCKNGKKLLRNLTDLVVIEKKEMSRNDFYRSYDISGIGGKLLAKPDEDVFKTSLDKKKKEKSIIYLASNNNQVFFSSYGDNMDQGKDIYIIRKLPTGEWSKPQTLGYPVNTEYDEDFPFLHPNGKVLYFCSKGHNSMGGYDIYKTTLNEETNTWNKPVNLDFPINTPDDDVLYVTNEDEKEAFFSSARASKSGKTAVYHINVERKPIDITIIKGAVVKNRDNQALDVKITVKDLTDNVILGIFNSKAVNGVYLINIPNGGKFLFTVEATGFATQSDVVEVPVQYVFRPMKQEISYEEGTDKLIIKNLFDEVLDDASYLLALNFIKEKSKMDVNVNEASTINSTAIKDTSATTSVAATTNSKDKTSNQNAKLSNDDIVKIGYSDAEEVANEATDLKEQANVALVLANQKNELAINKAKEAEQLMSDASKMDDNVKKQATIEEANAATKEAEDLNQETVAAFNLAKKIEFRASAKEQEADLSLQYAKDLEAAVKSKNTDPVLFAKLEEQQKKLDALAEQNNNPTLANSLKMDVDNKKREWEKAVQTSADIKQEIADNEALIITTQEEADKEKNAKVKQGLLDQVTGLKMDTEDSKKDLALNEQKVIQLQKDYNGAVNETTLVSSVYDNAKAVTNEKAAADVAMIDKAKLEAQVNTIKNTTTDNSTVGNAVVDNKTVDNTAVDNKAVDNAVVDNKTVDNKTVDNTVLDNAVVKVDYSKKFTDEIASTDNITNELERENKKVDVLKEWTASINEDLTNKKAEVKTEKDKTKKKELNTEIAALEKELKEKQKTTSTALATVEKLKKDGVVVADNTAKTTDNATTDNSTPVNINKKYSDEIAATDNISSATDRDKAKADILISWSKAIDADVAKKKLDMDASSDPEMKALLAIKIKQGEDLAKEKQQEADRLKNPSLVTNKTVDNKAVDNAVVDNKIVDNTVVDNKTVDNTVVDNKTVDNAVVDNKTVDNAVVDNKTVDNTVVDNKTVDNAVVDNKTVDNAVVDNKTVDNAVVDNKTVDNAVVDNKTVDNAVVDNKTVDNAVVDNKTVDNAVVDNTTKTTDTSSETGFAYTSSVASEQATKANAITKQVDDLTTQSNDLKTKAASENNAATKNDLYAKAEELDKQAEQKQIESAQIFAIANKTEYLDNQNRLNQFAIATKGNTADDISMAEMMKDEADIYFNRAQKSRDIANNSTSFYDKETALEDAYKNEMIALEKQKKANTIYLKYTPNVAVNSIDNKAIDNSTVDNKAVGNAVVDNKAVSNSTVENKTVDNSTIENKTVDNAVVENKTVDNKAIDNSTVGNTTIENKTVDNAVVGNKTVDNKTVGNTLVDNKTIGNSSAEIFVKTNVPVYSAAKPIPVNEKLPEGLIFKVQIGAFRNPIPQDLFKGMSPITGETTPQGFTRYTAGVFTTFVTADKVKEEIRALGYKDAFVVAFLNGKRIPMIEAMSMIGTPVPNNNQVAANTAVDNTTKTTDNTTIATNVAIPVNNLNSNATTPENTQNVATVGGLFYTVQIGVYSQVVSSSKLYNIQPLYTEIAPNGNFRYNTGIYNNIPRAIEAKNMIVDVGIKDAFVTAYYNGKRVSLPEAEKLIADGSATFSSAPNLNALPTFTASSSRPATNPGATASVTPPVNATERVKPQPTETVSAGKTNPPVNTNPTEANVVTATPVVSDQVKAAAEASNVMQIDSGVVFKVQIGAFREEIPLEIANKFLKISKKGVKNYKDANGLTIYTVGTYKTYAEANTVRTEVVNEAAIVDAFIIAYKDGLKITIEEARALSGN